MNSTTNNDRTSHAAELVRRYDNVIVSSSTEAAAIVHLLHTITDDKYTFVRYGLGWKVIKETASA
jgi:hypothetical protein